MSRSPRPAVAHRGDAGVVTAELAVLLPTVVVLLLEADTRAALLVTPVWFVALGAVWHLRVGRSRTQPDELVDAM